MKFEIFGILIFFINMTFGEFEIFGILRWINMSFGDWIRDVWYSYILDVYNLTWGSGC